jgi:hypothetical protein
VDGILPPIWPHACALLRLALIKNAVSLCATLLIVVSVEVVNNLRNRMANWFVASLLHALLMNAATIALAATRDTNASNLVTFWKPISIRCVQAHATMPIAVYQSQIIALIKLVVFLNVLVDLLVNPLLNFLYNVLMFYVLLLIVVSQLVQLLFVLISKTHLLFVLVENVLRRFVVRSSVEIFKVFVPRQILSEILLVTLVITQLAVYQPVILLPARQVMRNQWSTCSHAAMIAVMMFAARRSFVVIISVLLAGIQSHRTCPLSGVLPALARTQTVVPRTVVLTTFALQERNC